VTTAIRGTGVDVGAALLRFMPQMAAAEVARVLKCATANAENNHNLSAEDLIIVEAIANEGPTIKRFQPRAQGRAFPIHKPMTHITITVADQEA
jgi:large subunit ribosomal protein L22